MKIVDDDADDDGDQFVSGEDVGLLPLTT